MIQDMGPSDSVPISNSNEVLQGPIQGMGNCFERIRFLIGGPRSGAHGFCVLFIIIFNCNPPTSLAELGFA